MTTSQVLLWRWLTGDFDEPQIVNFNPSKFEAAWRSVMSHRTLGISAIRSRAYWLRRYRMIQNPGMQAILEFHNLTKS